MRASFDRARSDSDIDRGSAGRNRKACGMSGKTIMVGMGRNEMHTGDRCVGGIILKRPSLMPDLPRDSASPLIGTESNRCHLW